MTYTQQTWHDTPATDTPITAARLGVIEAGIAGAENRANHTGTQSADTLTDGTTNKAFLATERTKLAGVATAATANDTDANLKARANHTGTQLASTISDFSTAADARIAVATPVTDPWVLRRTNLAGSVIPQRRTFWGNKADTTTPSAVEDTGQTGVKYSTGSFPMKVLGGKLTFGPTGATVFDYRYFGDSAPLTNIGARFTFDSTGKSTTNGSVTLGIMNDDLDNQSLTTFRMAVHLTVTPTLISMDTGTNATGTMVFTPRLLRNFSSALVMDGKTVHTIEVFRVGSTLTILSPDGNTDTITDANISAFAGNYGFHELIGNSTDVLPSYIETWAGTGTQYPPTNQFMTNAMMRNHDAEAKTLINTTFTGYTESVVAIGTVTTANTIALTNGTVQTVTLTASTTCMFTMPTAVAGKSFVLLVKQAATTGNGIALFNTVKWPATGQPTTTATAGKMDIHTFVSDGVNWYGSWIGGYTP